MDANHILKDANLSDLVQFYDNNTIKYVWLHSDTNTNKSNSASKIQRMEVNCSDVFIKIGNQSSRLCEGSNMTGNDANTVNSLEVAKPDERFEINDEYWNLWNSNNLNMLNFSKNYYGHDGARVELGIN